MGDGQAVVVEQVDDVVELVRPAGRGDAGDEDAADLIFAGTVEAVFNTGDAVDVVVEMCIRDRTRVDTPAGRPKKRLRMRALYARVTT